MDYKGIIKALDEVLDDEPSQTSVDIYEYVGTHKQKAVAEYGNFIKQFEDIFHELNVIITYLNYVPKDSWKDNKTLQYLLYPEVMKTLHCAFENGIAGYYDEALMLHRSAYETILRIIFVSCYPDDVESIFVSVQGKRAFNATNFPCDNLKIDWRWLYALLSAICHSKLHKPPQDRAAKLKGGGKAVVLQYDWDENGMHMFINITTFNLMCLFHLVVSIFSDDFPEYDKLKKRIDRIMKIDDLVLSMIEVNPNKTFAGLSADLKKVGKIIKAAAAGDDWTQIS